MRDNLRLYSRLERELRRLLPQERIPRVRNLTLRVTGLFLARSVHLSQVVRVWPQPARLVSLENRLRRFLSNRSLSVQRCYAPVVATLLARFSGAPVRLILDLTQVGPAARMLSLSVAYRRRALPLVWRLYRGVKGNVPLRSVCRLLEEVGASLPEGAEVWVYGDSGFGQAEWIEYLRKRGWHFVLRLGGHVKVAAGEDPAWQKLCSWGLQEGQTRDLGAVGLFEKHALTGLRALLDRKERRDKSYFRLGWDYLAHCLRLGHDIPPLRLTPYVDKVIGG